jgi:hypothetical protein
MTTTPVAYRRIQRHRVPPDRQISVSLPPGRVDSAGRTHTESIAEAASTALHRTATKFTMTTKTKTQVSKRQFISALATIPSTIGMCHLAVYLELGTPAEGWASLTGFFVALPGWMVLARRYRRR